MMNNLKLDASIILSYAFRPLFLLVVIQALIQIPLWYLIWNNHLTIDWQFNPVYWHGHEMLAGFAGAAIAGFLLTAVATWTGREPVNGWPLLVLCLVWLLARLGFSLPLTAALAGIVYWLILLVLMAREVLSSRNRRNYKILLVILSFVLLESGFQWSLLNQSNTARQFLWAQLWLVVLMINLIGGRIIPAFTRNWLRRSKPSLSEQQLPAAFARIDIVATVALAVFALATLFPVDELLLLALGLFTSIMQLWRLSRWQGIRTFNDPLVWMLHLAYGWIPLGVLIFSLGQLDWLPVSAGIHALAIGTVASMIVSVASRAALGHTSRPLIAHPLLVACIVLLSLAALFRIAAAISSAPFFMAAATLFWTTAFICFAVPYLSILLLPPPEDQAHR
jgi:uncharacterized protein involved in response to NO